MPLLVTDSGTISFPQRTQIARPHIIIIHATVLLRIDIETYQGKDFEFAIFRSRQAACRGVRHASADASLSFIGRAFWRGRHYRLARWSPVCDGTTSPLIVVLTLNICSPNCRSITVMR